MGDDSIDMGISHIDMGYLVTLPCRALGKLDVHHDRRVAQVEPLQALHVVASDDRGAGDRAINRHTVGAQHSVSVRTSTSGHGILSPE